LNLLVSFPNGYHFRSGLVRLHRQTAVAHGLVIAPRDEEAPSSERVRRDDCNRRQLLSEVVLHAQLLAQEGDEHRDFERVGCAYLCHRADGVVAVYPHEHGARAFDFVDALFGKIIISNAMIVSDCRPGILKTTVADAAPSTELVLTENLCS